jgi:hypothetical protein
MILAFTLLAGGSSSIAERGRKRIVQKDGVLAPSFCYTRRLLRFDEIILRSKDMYNTAQDLLDALRATPEVLEDLLDGCTQEQATAARGGDEGWSVVEVVCHLRDAEEEALSRMRLMRDNIDPVIAAYDQERWAREHNYAQASLQDALAAFTRFRAQHVNELVQLSPQEWEHSGQHEEQGTITISSHTLHIVSHDAIHAAQIARQLKNVTLS